LDKVDRLPGGHGQDRSQALRSKFMVNEGCDWNSQNVGFDLP
jgi:hypothetical protein